MSKLTNEERQVAAEALIEAYSEYLEKTSSVRFRIKAKYAALADKQIEEEIQSEKAKLGRAIARSPLNVREKQRHVKSTNWDRYQGFLDAAGEIDVSSRQGRLQRDLESLKSEFAKNSSSQKTDSVKKSFPVEEVTEKMRSWEHYEGVLNDHVITVSEQARWFQATPTPGGEFRLWAMDEGDEKPTLVFKFPAGDDEWSDPSLEYDRGESKWAEERDAVVDAFNGEGSF